MSEYTVEELVEMAGVSVRTLHCYDEIGLLRPSTRTSAGYRLYRQRDLLRLQQLLFFKESDIELEEIRSTMDGAEFDQVRALRSHRRWLGSRRDRLSRLLRMIDKTIAGLTEVDMASTDEELYEGGIPEQAGRCRREAGQLYGEEKVERIDRRLKRFSPVGWRRIRQEGGAVAHELAVKMDHLADHQAVQGVVRRHDAWVTFIRRRRKSTEGWIRCTSIIPSSMPSMTRTGKASRNSSGRRSRSSANGNSNSIMISFSPRSDP